MQNTSQGSAGDRAGLPCIHPPPNASTWCSVGRSLGTLWSEAPVENQPHKNAFMQPLESRLQNIPKTKSVLYLRAFLGSCQLGGRRHEKPRSAGLANSACSWSRDPGRGTPRLHRPGSLPEAHGSGNAKRKRTSHVTGAPSEPRGEVRVSGYPWASTPTCQLPRTGRQPTWLIPFPPCSPWHHNRQNDQTDAQLLCSLTATDHSVASDSAIPWTVTCQVPLTMEFSRQENRSGLPLSPPGGSSQPRDRTYISCVSRVGRHILSHCTTVFVQTRPMFVFTFTLMWFSKPQE